MSELIINASLPEVRIALMEDGEIQELLIERPNERGVVGNIYKGRVTRVLPGMQAAFVDIGLEKAAFLYVDDIYIHGESEPEAIDEDDEEEGEEGYEAAAEGDVEAAGIGTESEGEDYVAEEEEGGSDADADADADSDEGLYASSAADESDAEESLDTEASEEEEEAIEDDDDGEADDENKPVDMEAPPGDDSEPSDSMTVSPEGGAAASGGSSGDDPRNRGGRRRRHRRGRRSRGGRRQPGEGQQLSGGEGRPSIQPREDLPTVAKDEASDPGDMESDRHVMTQLEEEGKFGENASGVVRQREPDRLRSRQRGGGRPEFREQRGRDRRIRSKQGSRGFRPQVNIQDLLKEGQEVIVQIAKDPIATKGARLTCHVSLPGRHLVCMPTIDHVGVSRRIERDEDRRRLRAFVEKNREGRMGFIVRTASSGKDPDRWLKQDMEYLTDTWKGIMTKAASSSAPALLYEDLNSIVRAVRDWVNEDVKKVIVDSRYHYNDIMSFSERFMPQLAQKVELYHGDIPIFDVYGISTELHRALERKVWLKSGGYIVIDQAEALVAIDVNTGRFVGKKNLEDTILKTNLEAVAEIAYQLRLRNLGGIIILDLIDMEKEENRRRVFRALEEEFRKDRARPTIVKMTDLGLIEMTRKRTRDSMIRAMCSPCAHCEGKGFIKSRETVAYETLREIEREGIQKDVKRILVQAHPEVINLLAIDFRETLDQLERRYRKQVYLQAILDYHEEQFEVFADRAERPSRGIQPMSGSRDNQRRGSRGGSSGGGQRRAQRGGSSDREASSPQDESYGDTGTDENVREPNIQDESPESESYGATPKPAPVIIPRGNQRPAVIENGHGPVQTPVAEPVAPGLSAGDDLDEEDRLAFLRAQAAQDAAIASLQEGADPKSPRRAGANGNGRGHHGHGGHSNKDRRGPGPNGGGGGRRGGRNRGRGRRGPAGPRSHGAEGSASTSSSSSSGPRDE